jgi:uncharacterized protein (DUF58 family)
MNASATSAIDPLPWHGPGADRKTARQHLRELTWRKLLWTILYPPRGQRIMPTVSGLLLISLALGIGSAAYNTSNNILFITLSLLLACLILSGVLSALNLSRVAWRVVAVPPFRVGQTGSASIELRNLKKLLPTYGLWFEVRTKTEPKGRRLVLRERLDPQGESIRLEWMWQPTQRGLEVIELTAVGSLFPFGFLRKVLSCEVRQEVLVWPAPVEYQRLPVLSPSRRRAGQTVSRIGNSGDLLAVRKYYQGDSHRLIHWKASARLRQLMVRQFSSEQQEGFSMHLDSSAEVWGRPEQFELLCRFVATLAEDLFTTGRLGTVAIDLDPPQPVRGLRELEAFFDRLARLTPRPPTGRPNRNPSASPSNLQSGPRSGGSRLTLTFAPDGSRGVAAYVDGQKAASA